RLVTLFPYTTLFRSLLAVLAVLAVGARRPCWPRITLRSRRSCRSRLPARARDLRPGRVLAAIEQAVGGSFLEAADASAGWPRWPGRALGTGLALRPRRTFWTGWTCWTLRSLSFGRRL